MTRPILFSAVLAILSGPAVAQRYSCGDLWAARNAIYKEAGYCFKTARAIRAFGNAGCQYDALEDVPLSPEQRARVAAIVRAERAGGCPR